MNIQDERVAFEGDWLRVLRLHCRNDQGEPFVWEAIERKRCAQQRVVVVRACLLPSRRYILIKQYRPTFDTYVVALPAGLVPDHDVEKTALDELRQETGYSGKIVSVSPDLAFSAAMTRELLTVVDVVVDETAPENQSPRQELEPEEAIEVILAEPSNVRDTLLRLQREGAILSSGVWYLLGNDPPVFLQKAGAGDGV